jgi:hypothetical protein
MLEAIGWPCGTALPAVDRLESAHGLAGAE